MERGRWGWAGTTCSCTRATQMNDRRQRAQNLLGFNTDRNCEYRLKHGHNAVPRGGGGGGGTFCACRAPVAAPACQWWWCCLANPPCWYFCLPLPPKFAAALPHQLLQLCFCFLPLCVAAFAWPSPGCSCRWLLLDPLTCCSLPLPSRAAWRSHPSWLPRLSSRSTVTCH